MSHLVLGSHIHHLVKFSMYIALTKASTQLNSQPQQSFCSKGGNLRIENSNKILIYEPFSFETQYI